MARKHTKRFKLTQDDRRVIAAFAKTLPPIFHLNADGSIKIRTIRGKGSDLIAAGQKTYTNGKPVNPKDNVIRKMKMLKNPLTYLTEYAEKYGPDGMKDAVKRWMDDHESQVKLFTQNIIQDEQNTQTDEKP